MPRYRKKPVEITAHQFTGDNAEDLVFWIGGDAEWYQRFNFGKPETKVIVIPTLEGNMEATEGDYIIKGVQGEFYPCKPDIFEQTYELVVSHDDKSALYPEFEKINEPWYDKWGDDHVFTPTEVDGRYVIGHSTYFGDDYKLRYDVLTKFYARRTVENAGTEQ